MNQRGRWSMMCPPNHRPQYCTTPMSLSYSWIELKLLIYLSNKYSILRVSKSFFNIILYFIFPYIPKNTQQYLIFERFQSLWILLSIYVRAKTVPLTCSRGKHDLKSRNWIELGFNCVMRKKKWETGWLGVRDISRRIPEKIINQIGSQATGCRKSDYIVDCIHTHA